MSALIAGLLSLAIAGATRPALVLVLEDSTPEGCFATEHVAAVIALTPGLRLVRGTATEGETLEATRARYGTDLAISGARKVQATGGEDATLSIARAGKIDTQSSLGPSAERIGALLTKMWPSELPPLADVGAPAAANADALEAACIKDAARAYASSGAAIGSIVRKTVAPPTAQGRTLFSQWAKASALARAGKCKDGVLLLRGISAQLARNEWGPTWRRAPRENAAPSALDLFNGTVIAFENGTFAAVDAKNGLDKWRLEVGTSTPHLTDAGDGLVLAALQDEVVAVDLEDGRVRWRVNVKSPSPEIAQMAGKIFVAGEADVLALDRSKGEIVWRYDPLGDMIAGPIVAGANLAVAAESDVILLDPVRGAQLKKIDLGDEISAPLTITAKGSIWAMVGSDNIVFVDPSTSEVRLRAKDLPGAEWPPALAAEQLVIALRRGDNRRAVSYLDPSAKNGIKRTFLGAAPPMLELPSFAGVVHVEERPPAIVARNLDGAVLWKLLERQKIVQLSRASDLIVAAVGSRVRIIEPKKGATVGEIDFGEPVKQIVLGAKAGAALVESGVVYGFPSLADVRPKSWAREARLELGDCFLVLNQGLAAAATARQILERDPDDLDALALFAAAEEKTKPREAAERWLALSDKAAKNDPVQADVERALHALAGIEGPLILDSPIKDAIAPGDDMLVIATESGVEARSLEPPFLRAWKKPLAETGAAALGHVRVGGELIHAKSGAKVSDLEKGSVDVRRGAMFRLKRGPTTELTRIAPDGKAQWTQMFGQPELSVADASNDYLVVVDSSDKAIVHVVRAETGERVWMLPLGERVHGASLSGDRVLFSMEKKMLAVDAETGKESFSIALPANDAAQIVPTTNGWLIAAKGKLRIVSRIRGKPSVQLTVPQNLTHVVAAENAAIAAFADGSIASIDLARGVIDGRLKLGKLTRLMAAGSKIVAVLESGTILVIDPTRKLRVSKV